MTLKQNFRINVVAPQFKTFLMESKKEPSHKKGNF